MKNDNEWSRRLAVAIRDGGPDTVLRADLDRLLLWLGNPQHPGITDLSQACADLGMTPESAAQRVYTVLDDLLFGEALAPHRIFALPASADAAQIKQRYRRLIQAYHPDRHPQRAAELTHYTERIVTAYRNLSQPVSTPLSTATPASQPRYRYAAYQPLSPPPLSAVLRRALGRSNSLQTWIFSIVLVSCGSVLAALYYADYMTSWPPEAVVALEPLPASAPLAALAEPIPEPAMPESEPAPLAVLAEPIPEPVIPEPEPLPVITQAEPIPEPVIPEPHTAVAEIKLHQGIAGTLESTLPPQPDFFATMQLMTLVQLPSASSVSSVSAPAPPTRTQPGSPSSVTVTSQPPPSPTTVSEPESKPEPLNCDAAHNILEEFARHYEHGNLNGLMALYQLNAQENAVHGRRAIRQLYQDWFNQTHNRQFRFSRIHITLTQKQFCLVNAEFDVGYWDLAQRRYIESHDAIRIKLTSENSSLRIMQLVY